LIDLGSDLETEVSQAEWNELRAGGWIEPTGRKTARPRRGVVMWIRGGHLCVAPLAYMPCATADWFLIWLYSVTVMSAAYLTETVSDRQERVALERERERQNEAAVWRARRDSKGRNEYCYMTPAQKAEAMKLAPAAEAA
jgi:hypothetical protein